MTEKKEDNKFLNIIMAILVIVIFVAICGCPIYLLANGYVLAGIIIIAALLLIGGIGIANDELKKKKETEKRLDEPITCVVCGKLKNLGEKKIIYTGINTNSKEFTRNAPVGSGATYIKGVTYYFNNFLKHDLFICSDCQTKESIKEILLMVIGIGPSIILLIVSIYSILVASEYSTYLCIGTILALMVFMLPVGFLANKNTNEGKLESAAIDIREKIDKDRTKIFAFTELQYNELENK